MNIAMIILLVIAGGFFTWQLILLIRDAIKMVKKKKLQKHEIEDLKKEEN